MMSRVPPIRSLRVRELRPFVRRAPMRFPFKFGASTMTDVEIVYVRVRIEDRAGASAWGLGACLLSPLWFDKRPERSLEERRADLLLSVALAVEAYLAAGEATAATLHRQAGDTIAERAREHGLLPLPASFGIALVDGAVLDALCRGAGVGFHAGLRGDLFGLGPELARHVPERPLSRLHMRHTVGMIDPLRTRELATPLDDGLPESLEQVIREYGVRWFKLKVSGDVEESLDRLARVAEVLDTEARNYRLTLDANEQFAGLEDLRRFVERADAAPGLAALWGRTLWIEQPLERDAALAGDLADELAAVTRRKPVILDESGGTDDATERALALGYMGMSAKYCKGVLRALHAHRTIAEWNERAPAPAVLSSEDLTATPLHPLHQDTCLAAALGIAHTERNGHHYVRGLSFLEPEEQAQALRLFPGFYHRPAPDLVTLRIRDGALDVSELHGPGFGAAPDPDWEALAPLSLPDPREGGPRR